MKSWSRFGQLVVVVCCALLTACGRPSNANVQYDVVQAIGADIGVATSIELTSMRVGEGDADSVYFVVDVRLTASESKTVRTGSLAGLDLKRGQQVQLRDINVLYQTTRTGQWAFVSYSR